MADLRRDDLTRQVYARMVNADFRALLTAVAPDGSRPVVVALPSDLVRDVLPRVESLGGAANLVVPVRNGFMVVGIRSHPDITTRDESALLVDDCTVGLLLSRVMEDMDRGYELAYEFGDVKSHATADLAGLAGG